MLRRNWKEQFTDAKIQNILQNIRNVINAIERTITKKNRSKQFSQKNTNTIDKTFDFFKCKDALKKVELMLHSCASVSWVHRNENTSEGASRNHRTISNSAFKKANI